MKKKVGDILGISERSVYAVLRRYKEDGAVKPETRRPRPTIIDWIDDFDKSYVRKTVHSFYLKGELPTCKKVLQKIQEDNILPNMGLTNHYEFY